MNEVKLVGIYATWAKTEKAVDRVREKPGFLDHPDGINIYARKLDWDDWREGLVRLRRVGSQVPDRSRV